MKKFRKPAFLVLLAGIILMMTGCFFDEDQVPGKWTLDANYMEWTAAESDNTFVGTGPAYVYTPNYYIEGEEYPASGETNYTVFRTTKDNKYKGFKATVNSTIKSVDYGFAFFINLDSKNRWSYYVLYVDNMTYSIPTYRIYKVANRVKTILREWTPSGIIEDANETNTYTVYTEKNGDVVIKANNKVLTSFIKGALEYTSGDFGVLGPINGDQYANKTAFKTTYHFEKFQR